MEIIQPLVTCVLSYKVCDIFTNPHSRIWKGLPKIETKRLEIFPSVRIKLKGKVIHFHHWLNFSILLGISVFVTNGLLDSWITRGFLVGGVLQGLSLPSARKFIYKEEWLQRMLK